MDNNLLDEKDSATDINKLPGPILIVGASGFVGANLFFRVLAQRDDVFACSRRPKNSWRLSFLDKSLASRLISADITDYQRIKSVLTMLKPRTVFGLAAYGSYSRQVDAGKIHMTNYIGALNLVRILSETGCDAFVHAGSSSEYGLNCTFPKESAELLPNSDYAVSKAGVSYLLKYYGRIHVFPCVNLRLYSVYGPWEERDRLIPTLITSCLKGRLPKFVAKSISRDFLYIDDCNSALVKSALTACKTHPGESFNIATGVKTTMEDAAITAKRLFNISSEPVFGSMPNRKWDMGDWVGDAERAQEIIGWKHKISFEKGLALTAGWEKEYEEKLKHVHIPIKQKKISVIIACYKDERSIPLLHERLTRVFEAAGYDYEIIFVNDASPFSDEKVIYSLSEKDYHVIGISHSRSFGSQSAFLSGMEISTGDAAVLMDGDGQDPPELISDFIEKWEKGYEVIYGQRTRREAPFYMQIFYKIFYRIFRKLADIQIPVDAGDFSLIDRKAVNYLLCFPEKDIFLRGLRAWIGFNQIGVPYVRPERLFGKSTNSFFKNFWWAKKAIFSFSMKPLQYLQSVGITMFFVTVLLSMFYLTYYFISAPKDSKGTTTIVLLVLGLGAIQLIGLSVIGDYISKIMEEVKNRPRFIRNKIIINGRIYDKEDKISEVLGELSFQRES